MFNAKASHIVGGELNYDYKGNNKYRIRLQLYVDCQNGFPTAIAQDITARIAVFGKNNNQLISNLSFEIKRNAPIRVSKTNYNCIEISPNACVDAYLYDTIITLPKRAEGYVLSFQRCCRNNTILNLISPEATGANIWTFVNDLDTIVQNSTPVFKNLPPNFLCTNTPLIFDHSAIDADGDSLVYEFFHPFLAATVGNPRPTYIQYEKPPFSLVNFSSAYNFINPINSSPNATINKKTGLLTITPTLSGQFVIGIIVKEYRNGNFIGFTQRDYQFNIQNCVFKTVSAFTTPEINCDKQVTLNNNSQNAQRYFWDFGDSAVQTDTSSKKIGSYTYSKIGFYNIKLKVFNGNCIDSIIKTIEIYDKIPFHLPSDTLLCKGATLLLKPDIFYTKTNYLWSTGSIDSTLIVNAAGEYWLKIQRINCITFDTINVFYDSIVVELMADTLKCDYKTLNYSGKVYVNGNYKSINWQSFPNQINKDFDLDSFSVSKKGLFVIFGNNSNNCPFTDSIFNNMQTNLAEFRMPNVFTPNNDGKNDFFPFPINEYQTELQIFNRWGVSIFKEKNQSWTGESMPEGVYYYFLKILTCENEISTHGVVHLIR